MHYIGCSRGCNHIAKKRLEAPSGLEPLSKGFADLPLSHLGTAPLKQGWSLYSKRERRASS